MSDEIHNPQHYRVPVLCEYDDDGQAVEGLVTVECRELARALALPFSLANVLKYLWRAGRKTPDKLKDLRKARAYLDWEIAALEREESGKGAP